MISTITSKQTDVHQQTTSSSSFIPSKPKTSRQTYSGRFWVIVVVCICALAVLIMLIGSILILFVFHSSTTATGSTGTITTTSTTTPYTCHTAPSPQPSNAWFFVGNLSDARYLHTSTFISQDNSILVTGGSSNGVTGLASMDRYIPSTGCFQSAGSLSSARYYHTADALSSLSSWIVIAGGYNGATALATADLYNPTTGSIITISLASAVYAHRSAVLTGSQLALIGGVSTSGVVNTGQVYNVGPPSTFTTTYNTMPVASVWHTATTLRNTSDLVLITGGTDGGSFYSIASLYHGPSNTFLSLYPSAVMSTARFYHTATYLPWPTDQVLITGGTYDNAHYLNTLILFDVTTLRFIPIAATMLTPRGFHTATLLPNGKVLIIGGFDGASSTNTCELVDPTNNFISTAVASLNTGRYFHTTTLISTSGNGTVLVCGGYNTAGLILNSCEIYIA